MFSNTLEISTGITLMVWGAVWHSCANQNPQHSWTTQGSTEVLLQSWCKAQLHPRREHLARVQKFWKVGKAPCCRSCLYTLHPTSSCFPC